jgi:hypothetical protein
MVSSIFLTIAGLAICTAAFYGLLFIAAYMAKKIMKD